jgi:hypothetical protein
MTIVLRHFGFAILFLCVCISCVSEANAQGESSEIVLRDGKVMKADNLLEVDSFWVFIGKDRTDGISNGVSRERVTLICPNGCEGAPRESFQRDLVVLKDGSRRFGEITLIKRLTDNYVILSGRRINLSEISCIKFADPVFDSFEKAFATPEKVTRLIISVDEGGLKHLPAAFRRLVNLEVLEISCLEQLKDLPDSIGNLRKLEKIIIDNGNGCGMSILLPASIGQLHHLRVLRLYGALDPLDLSPDRAKHAVKRKSLPASLANLANLEELDLGRNGIGRIPPQVASFHRLKKLNLDYNQIGEIPSFIGNLTSLKEMSLISNASGPKRPIMLPASLGQLRGLKVSMGNNYLTLKDQERIRKRFPKVAFSFDNDIDDGAVNEEAPDPKRKP